MIKRKVLILIMAMIFLLTGCSNNESNNNSSSHNNHDDEIIEMTDEEITLLCGIYVNEDRIKEGKLHDYQQKALEEFRMAKTYLQEKYPGYAFDFYHLSPSDKFQDATLIEFTIDESDSYYAVNLELVDDEYIITDNFYSYVLEPVFNEMLEKKLSEAGLTDFGVHASLGGFVGRDIDKNTTAEELLASGDEIKKDITVWVDTSGMDVSQSQEKATLIENTIRELKIYGGHIMYFGDKVVESCPTFKEFVEYRKNTRLESVSFNTFDMY